MNHAAQPTDQFHYLGVTHRDKILVILTTAASQKLCLISDQRDTLNFSSPLLEDNQGPIVDRSAA